MIRYDFNHTSKSCMYIKMDKAYEDFDGDDIADVKKSDNVIKFELLPGHPILLLTARGKDATDLLLRADDSSRATYSPYFSTGTRAGNKRRANMYKKHPSTAFDDVGKRKKLNISEYDCCPFTWEFEGFMKRLDWARAYYITYLQYELQRNMADEVEKMPFAPPATGEEECAMRGAETDESRTPQTVKQLTEQFKEMGREQVAHFEAQGEDTEARNKWQRHRQHSQRPRGDGPTCPICIRQKTIGARKRKKSDILWTQSFLGKRALLAFETLPNYIKQGTFEELVSAMKERLQEDGNVVRVKALAQLRKLNMRPDQTVEEFCAVLEKFVGKAYPDTPQEAVSLQMAEILFTQLAHWPGSYSLSEAIETSNDGEAYDNVKKAALRLERSRSAARERMRGGAQQGVSMNEGNDSGGKQGRFGRFTNISRSGIRPQRPAESTNRFADRQVDHMSGTETLSARPRWERRSIECYKCGSGGHISRNCTGQSRQPDAASSPRLPMQGDVRQDQRQGGPVSAWVNTLVCAVAHNEEHRTASGLFGQKTLADVSMLEKTVKALLDTGSETSIVPLKILHDCLKEGVNLDKFVERIPKLPWFEMHPEIQ
ncbi:unnamed protein product [Heligmosomoides polygyrus]|uniref:CCHC-type domain-containing protein n=1 Tax=Heligmosomoides polygyrus TaxID=6339 RepID=A0A183FU49_HELPZ|nr:unnamed protein product [Heligmosomoides polygyrus]